jgi:hypothetical protein
MVPKIGEAAAELGNGNERDPKVPRPRKKSRDIPELRSQGVRVRAYRHARVGAEVSIIPFERLFGKVEAVGDATRRRWLDGMAEHGSRAN